MNEWWEALSNFEKTFWYVAVPFSVVLAIQMILTFAGMGGGDTDVGGGDTDISGLDLDTDVDIDMSDMSEATDSGADLSDMDPTFSFFTIRGFIAFFTLFGWAGIAAIDAGLSKTITIIIAFAAGLVAMVLISTLFYFVSKMVDSGGALKIRNALNQIGDVYIPIKANAGNVGKIQVTVQGSLREMQAITKKDEDLSTGTVVKVTGVMSNSILVVEKFNK
jgi:membrane protein implicated in regulation of membrane protease activity